MCTSDTHIEQCVIYDWPLDNWKKRNDAVVILVPIVLQNFEETKHSLAIEQIKEINKQRSQTRIAEYNRDDATIVWIYDGATIENDNLSIIWSQLHLIRYKVRRFDSPKNITTALEFILTRQSERIVLLIDFVALYPIIDQLFRTPRLSLSVFVYNSTREIPFVSYISPDIQSCITSLAIDIELQTMLNVEFVFYESKQAWSASDLTASSAHFLWHLLLVEILRTIPVGNHYEFVSLTRCLFLTNPAALNEIDYFEMVYSKTKPEIWFDSKKSTVIQRILQNAFKQADIDTIYFARSIIVDLVRKIALSSTLNEPCHIFVGTMMNKKRIEFLRNHQDALLTPVGFLIGYTNQERIISRFRQTNKNLLEKVLFEIDVDIYTPMLDLSNDSVLFNIGVLFRILNVTFDHSLEGYRFRLETISNSNLAKELIDGAIELKAQVGENVNRNIFFGSLLVDMNCVRWAMNYFLFYDYHNPDNKEIEIDKLAELGRIALRCNKLVDAEKFLLSACDLHKKSHVTINDSVIGRIRLDLVLILTQQGRNKEAMALCRETLTILCDSAQKLSLTLLNIGQSRTSLCDVDLELTHTPFIQLIQEYEAKDYRCQHSVLIGGSAIEVGDMYRKKGLVHMASNCYLFANSISKCNQPTTHPMVLTSLHRLSELQDLTSVAEEIDERLTSVYQEIQSEDANDEANKVIADIGRRLALHFIRMNEHSRAIRWFEMCLSIYRGHWPLNEMHIHQCQAYIFKDFGSKMQIPVKISTEYDLLELNDILRSAAYMRLLMKPLLQEKVDEENRQWGKYNFFKKIHIGL
ncbi:unnamed protein product [Didymodactylos carnosus]|uniref:Uncharacterized protein n=1 Tax=Didymodactylos carnosus TaxID=1234261 RepID=A0A815BT70_9BILA|nr:unnamed protein product [Didymodactylos carnosus]CAF4070839.1 unnamed protein product [Didymodactylos carnosus]